MWQRSQPDLHDLADGRPVRQPHAKQARRREDWATIAAMVAHGGDRTAGRLWLARPQNELGHPARRGGRGLEWPRPGAAPAGGRLARLHRL